jgi:fatty acid desaturase
VFGFFYTPFLFLRGVLVARNLPVAQKRRIVAEYAFCAVAWVIVLSLLQIYGAWEAFAVGYLAQALIAGNLQSLRKFTEHVGLLGDTLLTKTRTVVDERLWGRLLSETMLHIDYHGTHHRFAKVPFYHLPMMTPHVYDGGTAHVPIFPSYASAMGDMFRSLGNPRVGAQWLAESFAADPPSRADEMVTAGERPAWR